MDTAGREGMRTFCAIATRPFGSKSSVNDVIKKLRKNGCVAIDANNRISLAVCGVEIEKMMHERHKATWEFFMQIGIEESIVRGDACKIERDFGWENLRKFIDLLVETEIANNKIY